MSQVTYGVRRLPDLAMETGTQEPRLSILSILVALFIVGASSLAQLDAGAIGVKILGAILAFFCVVHSVRAGGLLSPELFLYGAWVTWALTGIVGAQLALFRAQWATVFQIMVLIAICSIHANSRRTLSISLLAVLVGAAIVGAASVLGGSYTSVVEEERLTGLGLNSNGFGRLMVYATCCMMYFWMLPTRRRTLHYAVLGTGMTLAAMGCVLTGSRFSVGGLVLLYVLWFWYCYRKRALRRPTTLAWVLLIALVGGYGFYQFASESMVMERFSWGYRTLTGGRAETSTRSRLEFYRRGIEVITKHPLTGVGLNNVRWVTGRPAHSEYIEVIAGTGIPGGILYFLLYAVLWRRSGRLRRGSDDPILVRTAGLVKAMVLTCLFLGFGAPSYTSKVLWIIFGSFIGYTNAAWLGLRTRTELPPGAGAEVQPALPPEPPQPGR